MSARGRSAHIPSLTIALALIAPAAASGAPDVLPSRPGAPAPPRFPRADADTQLPRIDPRLIHVCAAAP